MKNLVLHIRYLLTQHDCVIVPGWGALVVQHSDAQFAADNTLLPPRRWLSFNPLLTHNDAMLAHSLMRADKCSYEEAMLCISEHVAMWREALKSGDNVVWDRVGSFAIQNEGVLLFSEAADFELNATLNFLQPIALKSLTDVLPALEDEEAESEAAATTTTITWRRHVWQAVASVAAIVVMMLCISTPVDNYEASNDYAGLVAGELLGYTADVQSITDVEDFTIVEPVAAEVEVTEDSETSCEDVAVDVVAAQEVVPQKEVCNTVVLADAPATVVATTSALPRYILVIGSLPTQLLAQKQIAEFQRMGVDGDIKIYENSGKYRLYIDGYDTMAQAQAQLTTLSSQPQSPFAGIWICATR